MLLFVAHFVDQCATTHDFAVRYRRLVVLFTIQRDIIYVLVVSRNAVGYNGEGLSLWQLEHNFRHLRSAEHILAAYRVDRIEAHSREHVPG